MPWTRGSGQYSFDGITAGHRRPVVPSETFSVAAERSEATLWALHFPPFCLSITRTAQPP